MALMTDFLLSENSWISPAYNMNGLFPISEVDEEPDAQSLHESVQGDDGNGEETASVLPPPKRRRINAYCATCGQQFTEKRSLYRHQRSSKSCTPGNLQQENYSCRLCAKVFTRADILQRHEKEHHQSQGRRKNPEISTRPLAQGNDQNLQEPSRPEELMQLNENESIEAPALISPEDDTPFHILDLYDVEQAHGDHLIGAETAAADSVIFPAADEDASSMRSATSRKSLRGLFSLPFRSRLSLERLGASSGYRTFNKFPPCPACKQPFEIDSEKLMAHVHSHVQDWQQEFVCAECDIGFQCQRNLEYHLVSASQGSCGFIGFKHPCTGHHPPNRSGEGYALTQHEHLMLCSFLRHWEKAQLDSLIISIDELTLNHPHSNSRRWSFSIARRPPSSKASSSIVPPSFRSEPQHFTRRTSITIQAIEQKLSSLSRFGPSALIRSQAAENARMLKVNLLNRSLYQAIKHGEADRVKSLLRAGAEVNALSTQKEFYQVHFLTSEPRYPDRYGVYQHSQAITPLAHAAMHRQTEIVDLLARHGAEYMSPFKDFSELDLTGLRMVKRPAALTLAILRRCAKASIVSLDIQLRQSSFFRLEARAAKSLADLIIAPDTAHALNSEELIVHLIFANFALGLQAVLELGANVNQTMENGFSILEYAVVNNSSECALLLIQYGARCSPPVAERLISEILKIILSLVERDFARFAKEITVQLVHSLTKSDRAQIRNSILPQVRKKRDAKDLKSIFAGGGTFADGWSETLLFHILEGLRDRERRLSDFLPRISFDQYRRARMVQVSVPGTSDGRISPTEYAHHSLGEHGTRESYGSSLYRAVMEGNFSMINMLLKDGVDPNTPAHGDEPPLFLAARLGDMSIFQFLVQNGANPHHVDVDWGAALIKAVCVPAPWKWPDTSMN